MRIKDSEIYKKARGIYHKMRFFGYEGYKRLYLPYYRDVFSKKILDTRPCETSKNSSLELHHLTCKKDLVLSLWALKSFIFYSKMDLKLFIHEDGSLDDECSKALSRHFPNAVIVRKAQADAVVRGKLSGYEHCSRVRFDDFSLCPYSVKLFDYYYFSESKNILHLDSDILFFKTPLEALDLVKKCAGFYLKDCSYAYTFKQGEIMDLFKVNVVPFINVGFFFIPGPGYFDLALMEDFFKIAVQKKTSPMWWEQVLFAVCFAKSGYGYRFLGPDYQIFRQKITSDTVMHHFTRPVRNDLYSVGLRRLHKTGFLTKLS